MVIICGRDFNSGSVIPQSSLAINIERPHTIFNIPRKKSKDNPIAVANINTIEVLKRNKRI